MARTPSISAFQHRSALTTKALRFDLSRFDPTEKPLSSGDKDEDKARVIELAEDLNRFQDLFYADRRFRLLVVLQGTDTSGKDGTIRGVFGKMSALGVQVVGWKAPNDEARARDYLWRIHQRVPVSGEIVIFNRSHYEDVLVPVVNGVLTKAQTQQRYAHINDFERMLTETGTVILKFMLHISRRAARALARAAERPGQTLEVRRRRPRCPQEVGRLPKGLFECHRRDWYALGALDHRAREFEDASQSDGRDRHEAGARRIEAEVPAGRSGAESNRCEMKKSRSTA